MKLASLLLFCILLFSSASSYSQKTSQMQKVVKTHDLIMEKMPKLVQLTTKLKPYANTSKNAKKYQTVIQNLKSSNQSMMNWMQDFGKRFTADEMFKEKALSKQKLVWIAEENVKIQALSKQVDCSIAMAEELLQNK